MNVVSISSKEVRELDLVTVSELAVAREYYRLIVIDYSIVNKINALVVCGEGYTRKVANNELLLKIREVDRSKVMRV